MKKIALLPTILSFIILSNCAHLATAQTTQRQYLSGPDKDEPVLWDFFCTAGRQSEDWTKIPVPSNWELQGFGTYNYGDDSTKADEKGKYRYRFSVPTAWKQNIVKLVFEGVMTDTEVWINGRPVSPKHQGGFYRFQYDVTDKINFGEKNLIEVTVSKVSSNPRVEAAERQADYWVFGGIYRPVYLEALPTQHIDWAAIDARANGSLLANVYLKNITAADRIIGKVTQSDLDISDEFTAEINKENNLAIIKSKVTRAKPWTAETPHLYHLELRLMQGSRTIHQVTQRFGFRTIEVRPGDGVYLNDVKILFKGVNRHSFWPDSGRALSRQICYEDARLIKSMNMNAVRMSHYPPDTWFLDACDELGLYVLNEFAGWQKPPYDTETGKRLVKQMVIRDVNHPCILFWDNANEGGWNRDLDGEFAKFDPQNRTVLHPWELFNHIDTDHYENYASVQKKLSNGNIFMTTEFLHGLYDGGLGAGLNDYWSLIKHSPLGAGGFLWALLDEGVVRTDKDGIIDVVGNQAPDGIVGPYRQKEGSFYTIKEIFSPVQINMNSLPESFDGTVELKVKNEFHFTNLKDCRFQWQLVVFDAPGQRRIFSNGSITSPNVNPGDDGILNLELPSNWRLADVLYISAYGTDKSELWTWSCPLKTPTDHRQRISPTSSGSVTITEKENSLIVTSGNFQFAFDKINGRLIEITQDSGKFSFSNGPCLATSPALPPQKNPPSQTPSRVNYHKENDYYVLEVENPDGFDRLRWKIHPHGLLELLYRYTLTGAFDYFGVTFDYPEDKMQSMQWLGAGPCRVWKNRLKGTHLDLFQRNYNDNIPGQTWDYPKFKGYFADLRWVTFKTNEGSFTVATDTKGLFLRLFTPKSGHDPRHTAVPFPAGDISFMHAISPIGTKFLPPDKLGPESQKTQAHGSYQATLYFNFNYPD